MGKLRLSVYALAAIAMTGPAMAETEVVDGIPPVSIATSMPDNGDPAGARKWLAQHGITYGLVYTGEALRNASGGIRRGSLYQGKLEAFTAIDFGKLAGWQGLSFFGNAFQIHRTSGMRAEHFNSLITISNIEAVPSTRLSELWLEQKLFDDRFGFRFGQLAADAEFFISDYSRMFLSSDWPTITGANLPSGGPAYPLATPGVRWRFDPDKHWSALVAVFNGDPGEQGTVNTTGTNFRINDPPLLMGELQFRHNQGKDDSGLAGIYRLGAWHHFGEFHDHRFGTDGLALADPLSNGIARRIRGNSGIYGVIDQQIYRPANGGPDSGIGIFSRISASPSDSSHINFFFDGGIVFSGMIPGRPNDRFGASFIRANIANNVRAFDRDVIAHSGIAQPVRSNELTIELSYQAQIKPGWTLQPTFEYVTRPGGHISDPDRPERPIKSGAIFGVRTTIAY
ncbi:carbohydrate porin [Bradyrhizobium roseum]|uniref:carbohydrate porin n=1 Tax=Bradyrhizobium roseum TaxID=3056648 RepID=UPI00262E3FF4|nr:carbohydrate porin [Bradyrhizobium roseus]WKA28285.1 carbohydrate porin [Bradyrhizobium roseus]